MIYLTPMRKLSVAIVLIITASGCKGVSGRAPGPLDIIEAQVPTEQRSVVIYQSLREVTDEASMARCGISSARVKLERIDTSRLSPRNGMIINSVIEVLKSTEHDLKHIEDEEPQAIPVKNREMFDNIRSSLLQVRDIDVSESEKEATRQAIYWQMGMWLSR